MSSTLVAAKVGSLARWLRQGPKWSASTSRPRCWPTQGDRPGSRSARRLPFAAGTFDAVIAVEVFEHLAAIDDVLSEARRVLRSRGILAIVDKNAGALNVDRPWLPSLVVKRIDELRGAWMYPANSPVRERWFWPGRFRTRLRHWFEDVQIDHILSPKKKRITGFSGRSLALA